MLRLSGAELTIRLLENQGVTHITGIRAVSIFLSMMPSGAVEPYGISSLVTNRALAS